MVMTTDGVRESRASDGAEFGSDRVVEALRGSTGSDDDLRRIHEALMRFSKGVRHDDVTVLSLARES
jgi:serine phosphatase RsbU (regulator of sigma subunit)